MTGPAVPPLHRLGVLVALLAAGAGICSPPLPVHAADAPVPLLEGLSADEILRRGEVMYRNGVLPNGEPLQAVVMGDVPVEGSMFTCVSCHLRSGFGSNEGQVRTPPIDGKRLYAPVSMSRGAPLVGRPSITVAENVYRPAYTDETLGLVMSTGLDPAGRRLNPVMPVYVLNDQDRAILVHYLKHLSTEPPPGITETSIEFATVVADDVPDADRKAMVDALRSYIANWRLPGTMERGMRSSLYRREGAMKGLRTLTLDLWELKGDPAGWQEQLEAYYRAKPVFALLGGITTRSWEPIHRFCEDHRIPSIFPVTDLPVISDTDWYTLYLSKGYHQEGETAARFLHGREYLPKAPAVVQVLRDEPAGRSLSQAFEETWTGLGHAVPERILLGSGQRVTASFWKELSKKHTDAIVLLWLNAADFPDLAPLANERSRPSLVFASASLLEQHIYTVAESARGFLYLTYPNSLPQESKGQRAAAGAAQRSGEAPSSRRDAALAVHTLSQALTDPLTRMRTFVSRDYFLELIESSADLTAFPVLFPRLSFGQGQRYASKGCYIVQLSGGTTPTLIKKSDWVIH